MNGTKASTVYITYARLNRFYYDEKDLAGWTSRAGLKDAQISATGTYGYRLLGYKP